MSTVMLHATRHVTFHLERSPVDVARAQYEVYFVLVSQIYEEMGRHLKTPIALFSLMLVLEVAALFWHPGSSLLPCFVVMTVLTVGQFGASLVSFCNLDVLMSDLAALAARRAPPRGDVEASLAELHLKQFATTQRPRVVVLGAVEMSYPSLFTFSSFVLSFVILIVFETE